MVPLQNYCREKGICWYIQTMSNSAAKPDIYLYFNYREYLSALFKYNKAINPVFSHRYIVSKAGFKSPNSLKNVINGERHISIEGAERFALAFKMDDQERRYFIALVKFNSTDTSSEKERCLSELMTLRSASLPARLSQDQMNILSAWWHVAIREMVALPDFKNSPLWVSRVLIPAISHADAAASLRMLKKTGFIRKTAGGWEPVDKSMKTDAEVKHVYAGKFHREMIELGRASIGRFTHDKREVSGTTMRIAKDDVPKIKALLQHFRRQLLDFAVNSESADQVYQLNFQFFPLVRPARPSRLKGGRVDES